MSEIKIEVDGEELEARPGEMLIQVTDRNGIYIPRFCYHDALSVAANCRMCLVEVERAPKPMPACATPVMDGMKVMTRSKLAIEAQKGTMEFLLINHPLDCPVCDQGGECPLQDQAMGYGKDDSRFMERKRSVPSHDIGPLVATEMTRCIHCTRCVRFLEEIAGTSEMGGAGRGDRLEIGTCVQNSIDSELSGNIIDLCPVGALTSKPYAFTARPWELTKTETIDVMDALGSNIRVDTKGREVMRILPRNHDGVNEEWISDKTQFVWDGLRRQRLDRPYVRENGKLRPASWEEALGKAADAIKGAAKLTGLIGDLVSVEAAFALKALVEGQGGQVESRTDGTKLPAGNRSAYVGTAQIEDIDTAKFIQLIGTNPREEAPVLNARIRKAWLNGAQIGLVGEAADLTYEYAHVGTDRAALAGLSGKNYGAVLEAPSIVIVGQGALIGADGAAVLSQAMKLAEETGSKFMVLHTAAGRVGALDIGATAEGGVEAALDGADVVFNLGADEIDIAAGAFVIYQGSHGDRGAHRADVILPAAAYTEENALFVNTEGRPQLAMRAGFAPGEAKENWAILRALSGEVGRVLPYDSLAQLRSSLIEAHPHLAAIDEVAENEWTPLALSNMGEGDFVTALRDFYLSNPIARASSLMAELSSLAKAQNTEQVAAE